MEVLPHRGHVVGAGTGCVGDMVGVGEGITVPGPGCPDRHPENIAEIARSKRMQGTRIFIPRMGKP